ncbi:MAG: hypothetical protein ACTSU6_03405 [Candidatus Njordarchaeales archaeon]
MSLFQAAVIKKDGKTVSKTLLLNTLFVNSDFYQNDTGGTVFYYTPDLGRRDKATEYIFDGILSQFKDLLAEASVNEYISITGNGQIDNLRIRFPNKRFWQIHPNGLSGTVVLKTDSIYECEDKADAGSSIIKYTRGNFEKVWLDNPFTISQIDGSASGSGSMFE